MSFVVEGVVGLVVGVLRVGLSDYRALMAIILTSLAVTEVNKVIIDVYLDEIVGP